MNEPRRVDLWIWGRSLHEYSFLFNLTIQDLGRRILDVSGGPASFNAELTALGGSVLSVDPLYGQTPDQIAKGFQDTLAWARRRRANAPGATPAERASDDGPSPKERIFERFFEDFVQGREEGRYLPGKLPDLSMIPSRSFDLCLNSWFIFSYAHLFGGTDFALRSILELLRVAREVRIYPLRSFPEGRTEGFDECIEALQAKHSHLVYRMPNGFLRRDSQTSADMLVIKENPNPARVVGQIPGAGIAAP